MVQNENSAECKIEDRDTEERNGKNELARARGPKERNKELQDGWRNQVAAAAAAEPANGGAGRGGLRWWGSLKAKLFFRFGFGVN